MLVKVVVVVIVCVLGRREDWSFLQSLDMVIGVLHLRYQVFASDDHYPFHPDLTMLYLFVGGATLIFEVELLEIDRKEEL